MTLSKPCTYTSVQPFRYSLHCPRIPGINKNIRLVVVTGSFHPIAPNFAYLT